MDAVRQVTGLETTTDGIPLHGMLDPDILTAMLRQVGARKPQIRSVLPAIMEKAQALYVRRCPELSDKICPGVRGLLERLRRRGIPLALVTGNLARIGWRKMERCGLRSYFRYGAFAGMARDRSGLARMAIHHARREGWIHPDAIVSLIGDAPSDILAAKANRARSVAVHTGISTRAELAAHAPDLLVERLSGVRIAELL